MGLSTRDRSRYARHLLLPQIGEAGQSRLLDASVRAAGDADTGALRVATEYLERAGLRVSGAGKDGVLPVPTSALVERVAGDPALEHAARALIGAFSAVEALRAVIPFGERAKLEFPTLTLTAEDA